MQLNTKSFALASTTRLSTTRLSTTKVATALAAASCTLLGVQPIANAAETTNDNKWKFDSTVLIYTETDRVSALEPVISARKEFSEDEFLNLKLIFDTLTGSSANGATATATSQTITKPSGKTIFIADANETPLDPSFRDTRVAISGSWEQPLSRLSRISFGGNFSNEFDYQSVSANTSISHDFNQRNTTLNYGISLASDTITPVGGIPIPLSDLASVSNKGVDKGASSDTRTTIDFLVGVTQVISRRTIMQFNYSLGDSSGYHTDPYKILSVIDGTTGDTLRYIHDSRPENRQKQSFYWQTKHHFKEDIVDVSYRYFSDDWGIKSHTIDFRYQFRFIESKSYLEPHIRYYSQDAADFYSHSLVDGSLPTDYATADYRLGELDGTTIGIKYGTVLSSGSEFSFRVEFLTQSGDSNPGDAIGSQRSQDLFPTVNALVIQASYSLSF